MILSSAATLLLLVAFTATGAPASIGKTIAGRFSASVQSKTILAMDLASTIAPTIVDGRVLQDQSNATNAPVWATTPSGSHWACHGAKPLVDAATDGTIPVCLKISPGGVSTRPGRVPSRALCLLGATKPASPPVYCYNDPEASNPNMYLWWSPCEKCGTAWRLFEERDDDQSWYKLPAYPKPLGDELPSDDGWLGWTGDAWTSTSMSITPCEQPQAECSIFDSGGHAELDWNDEQPLAESPSDHWFWDGPLLIVTIIMLVCCGCCINLFCGSSNGNGGGRSQWNHGYSGGGGGGDGGGCGGGDGGGGGGGGGGGDGGGC